MKTLLVLTVLFVISFESSRAYKAAVFEHYPLTEDNPSNTILKNLDAYRQYIETARNQEADILVFPEYGLTNVVDNPAEYAIDINDSNIITELRTMAKENSKYLVVNLLEKVENANTKTKYYNTALVFDRNGTIILKYRKINLLKESFLTAGDANQTVTFTTDFGVTFGILTGSDILYDNPSRRIFDNEDVANVVAPTLWYATEPFFTSLSVQHGYSLANGVNLLAASYGKPRDGHGGSGIFKSDGTIAEMYISDSPSSKRIIQEVDPSNRRVDRSQCLSINSYALPGDLDRSNVTNFSTFRNFEHSKYTFKNVDLTTKSQTTQICHGDFCCTFELTMANYSTEDHYKLVAYKGPVYIQDNKFNVRFCSLLACENDNENSCGGKVNVTSRFTKILVKGNLEDREGDYYVPTTQNTYLLPITPTHFCNNNNGTNSTFVQLQTTRAQSNVVVFGLLGKVGSGAASVHAFGFVVLAAFALSKYFVF